MFKFKASIEYTPDTIRRLNHAINNTFRYRLKLLYLGFCIMLIAAGAIMGIDSFTGILCIAFGCFLLPSANAMEKHRAKEQIRRMNGKLLRIDYFFYNDRFLCSIGRERNEFSYDSIIRLLKEADHYYLFPNTLQAYMISKSSVSPPNQDAFEHFIEQKVGLKWTKTSGLLTTGLRQLKFNYDNTRHRKV